MGQVVLIESGASKNSTPLIRALGSLDYSTRSGRMGARIGRIRDAGGASNAGQVLGITTPGASDVDRIGGDVDRIGGN